MDDRGPEDVGMEDGGLKNGKVDDGGEAEVDFVTARMMVRSHSSVIVS